MWASFPSSASTADRIHSMVSPNSPHKCADLSKFKEAQTNAWHCECYFANSYLAPLVFAARSHVRNTLPPMHAFARSLGDDVPVSIQGDRSTACYSSYKSLEKSINVHISDGDRRLLLLLPILEGMSVAVRHMEHDHSIQPYT